VKVLVAIASDRACAGVRAMARTSGTPSSARAATAITRGTSSTA